MTAPACTGVSAAWCPRCGNCTCPDRESAKLDHPDCLLHGLASHHADGHAEDGHAEAGRDQVTAEHWAQQARRLIGLAIEAGCVVATEPTLSLHNARAEYAEAMAEAGPGTYEREVDGLDYREVVCVGCGSLVGEPHDWRACCAKLRSERDLFALERVQALRANRASQQQLVLVQKMSADLAAELFTTSTELDERERHVARLEEAARAAATPTALTEMLAECEALRQKHAEDGCQAAEFHRALRVKAETRAAFAEEGRYAPLRAHDAGLVCDGCGFPTRSPHAYQTCAALLRALVPAEPTTNN